MGPSRKTLLASLPVSGLTPSRPPPTNAGVKGPDSGLELYRSFPVHSCLVCLCLCLSVSLSLSVTPQPRGASQTTPLGVQGPSDPAPLGSLSPSLVLPGRSLLPHKQASSRFLECALCFICLTYAPWPSRHSLYPEEVFPKGQVLTCAHETSLLSATITQP